MIIGRFGRESTGLKDGKYVKDLSYLNRPLSEIVYIDFDDEYVAYHKENCIILPKFEGQEDDRELIDLIPFLDRKFINKFTYLIFYFVFKYRSCQVSR
jgi:import inner membrane translocase subunit TIM50